MCCVGHSHLSGCCYHKKGREEVLSNCELDGQLASTSCTGDFWGVLCRDLQRKTARESAPSEQDNSFAAEEDEEKEECHR